MMGDTPQDLVLAVCYMRRSGFLGFGGVGRTGVLGFGGVRRTRILGFCGFSGRGGCRALGLGPPALHEGPLLGAVEGPILLHLDTALEEGATKLH